MTDKELYAHPMCPVYAEMAADLHAMETLESLQRRAHVLGHAMLDLAARLQRQIDARNGEAV